MKIGIVCYPTYGGSSVIATELGLAMGQRGHDVHFISYDIPVRLIKDHPNITLHKVNVVPYPLFKFPPYTMALASTMARVITEYKLDVLHVHYAIPHSTSAFLAKHLIHDSKTKVVTTLHGTDVELIGLDPSYLDITRFSIMQSDRVTAVSGYLKKATEERLDIKNDVTVIPNFVDTDYFCPDPKVAKFDCPTVIHISNFRPVKRIADTIRCFYFMQKKLKCRLVLAGDGPEMKEAQETVKELGLGDKVEFLGFRDDIKELILKSHFLLLTSQTESFGLAALEALSLGVPVLSTRVGGIPEVVEDNVTGFLEDVSDIERLAARGVELLADPQRYRLFSTRARKSVLDRYDTKIVTPLYEKLYREAIA